MKEETQLTASVMVLIFCVYRDSFFNLESNIEWYLDLRQYWLSSSILKEKGRNIGGKIF